MTGGNSTFASSRGKGIFIPFQGLFENRALWTRFFITIVPKNRSEVKQFYEFLKTNPIEWQYAYETPSSRKKSETVIYKTYEGEPSKNGYRIIWIHSSAKEKQDKSRRENRIAKADLQLTELSPRLNQYQLKTKEKIEEAIKKATKGASDLFQIQLIEDKQIVQRQIGPGKPGPKTRYKEEKNISYRIEWEIDHKAIKDLASRDGIFPLITNADVDAAEVLKAYKNQPYLEKRMYTAKSILMEIKTSNLFHVWTNICAWLLPS